MGISRDSRHKRSATGAKRAYYRKKRYVRIASQHLLHAAYPSISGLRRSIEADLVSLVEPSRRAVSQPILVLAPKESILSAHGAATPNTALFVSTPATSAGAQKVSPAKSVSSVYLSILPTMNLSVRIPLPNPPSSKWMLHPSDNGLRHTTVRS